MVEIPLAACRLLPVHQEPRPAPHVAVEELHPQLLAPLRPGVKIRERNDEARILEQVDRHGHQVPPRLHVLQQSPLSGPGHDDRAQHRVLLQRTGDFAPQ